MESRSLMWRRVQKGTLCVGRRRDATPHGGQAALQLLLQHGGGGSSVECLLAA